MTKAVLDKAAKNKQLEKRLSMFFIIYFMLGVLFAFFYAIYYHWSALAYFSPGFYAVILTWPIQTIGLTNHLLQYGLNYPF